MRFGIPRAKAEPILTNGSFNYRKDKRGWVTYKNGKRKKKLRNYVADLALMLGRLNKKLYSENRSLLIEYYNKDGIQGINRAAKVASEEHYNRTQKS